MVTTTPNIHLMTGPKSKIRRKEWLTEDPTYCEENDEPHQ